MTIRGGGHSSSAGNQIPYGGGRSHYSDKNVNNIVNKINNVKGSYGGRSQYDEENNNNFGENKKIDIIDEIDKSDILNYIPIESFMIKENYNNSSFIPGIIFFLVILIILILLCFIYFSKKSRKSRK